MRAPLRPSQDAPSDLLGVAPQHTLAVLAAPRRSAIFRAVAAQSFGAGFTLGLLAAMLANLLMLVWVMASGDYSGLSALDALGRGLLADMLAALCWGALCGTLSGVLGGLGAALVCVVRFWPAAPDGSYRWAVIIPSAIYAVCAVIVAPWVVLGAPLSLLNMAAVGPLGLRTIAFLLLFIVAVGWIAWRQVGRYAVIMGGHAPRMPLQARWEPLLEELRDPAARAELLRTAGTRHVWRAALLRRLDLRPGMRVLDLMCGSGLLWGGILRAIGTGGSLVALESRSSADLAVSQRAQRLGRAGNIRLTRASALATGLPDCSVDVATCAFGLAEVSVAEHERLVAELDRVLVPGGVLGVVERTAPHAAASRRLAQHYPTGIPALRQLLESYGFFVTTTVLAGGAATLLLAMKMQPDDAG